MSYCHLAMSLQLLLDECHWYMEISDALWGLTKVVPKPVGIKAKTSCPSTKVLLLTWKYPPVLKKNCSVLFLEGSLQQLLHSFITTKRKTIDYGNWRLTEKSFVLEVAKMEEQKFRTVMFVCRLKLPGRTENDRKLLKLLIIGCSVCRWWNYDATVCHVPTLLILKKPLKQT